MAITQESIMCLYIPGAVVIGRQNSGGGAGGADLSDIDFTAAALDERIVYQCASSKTFYAADGTIQFAEPDIWPLEYRNGKPVGRHEPEPQRTNYRLGSRGPTVNLYQLKKGGLVISPAGIAEAIEYITTTPSGSTATPALHSDLTLSDDCKITMSALAKRGTVERMYLKKELIADTADIPADDYALTVLRTNYIAQNTNGRNRYGVYFTPSNGATGYAWNVQLEIGEFATSPIISTTAAATRAAAFAFVKNPGGLATAIRVHYSDGTATDIACPAGGADISLPQSSTDWGTRYITRIQYARAF